MKLLVFPVLIPSLVIALLFSCTALAKGDGPTGLWPVSERYVLVADTSLPGLVLVDLDTGIPVERLVLNKIRPVCVASCPNCDFALISGGQASYWLLHFSATVAQLLQGSGNLDLNNARLEPLDIRTAEKKLTDGRMCLVSDDGKTAFVAAKVDHMLARVDLANTSNAVALIKGKRGEPYGLNWDRNGDLLVSMHKEVVWRMTAEGKVLAIYDTTKAGCPGTIEQQPNLRAAIDDPLNEGSLLILATNPRTYDAVVWRLSVDAQGRQTCTGVAGKIGHDPGWVDASGESTEFSRPHYFVPRPDSEPPQLIITDIDNRALRLLDLSTSATTTVMYDRDQLVSDLPEQERFSRKNCAELRWPTAAAASGPRERPFCVEPPQPGAKELSLGQATEHCSAAGARLCEPAELLVAGLSSDWRASGELARGEPARGSSSLELTAWTAAACASCWQRNKSARCAAVIEDHKTPGVVHAHMDFAQSWNSGQALVVAATSTRAAATLCRPVTDQLTALAPCCADAAPVVGE